MTAKQPPPDGTPLTLQAWQREAHLCGHNAAWLESEQQQWHSNKQALPGLAELFDSLAKGGDNGRSPHPEILGSMAAALRSRRNENGESAPVVQHQVLVNDLINAYRQWGYEKAQLDPLQLREVPEPLELQKVRWQLEGVDPNRQFAIDKLHMRGKTATLGQIIDWLERVYCGSVGVEVFSVTAIEERDWLLRQVEVTGRSGFSAEEKLSLLELLTAAEGLEKYLARTWPGAKRFGLEGAEALIPMLNELIQRAGSDGVVETMIGMAHRGRLNVLVNTLGKNPRELFDEFSGSAEVVGSGDVKYHQGFSSNVQTAGGEVHLALAFNPSHLEIVAPVVQGSVRARQDRRGDFQRNRVLPIIIHGDAAFSAQGVVMETFQMSGTRAHNTGGTIHIVLNNQIGFTTSERRDARSTKYCTDVAKMLSIPVFHVNADDPEAVLRMTRIALDYRQHFHRDIIIELFCYRRLGHNEADEPMMTQPLMYRAIRAHPSALKIYADKLVAEGVLSARKVAAMERDYRISLSEGRHVLKTLVSEPDRRLFVDWSPYLNRRWNEYCESGVAAEKLRELSDRVNTPPADMVLNRQVEKMLAERVRMGRGELPLNWGAAETLAYASLLAEGHSVRLVGQDSARGTFAHRHTQLHDQDSGRIYCPLKKIAAQQGQFMVYDSLLSELGELAFEYGYAATAPNIQVVWEAQFGDFVNGAQIVIDQFLCSGEAKWGRLCGMILLLPHGYEGQGPEHSSARLERFLQLSAQDNMQVCIPSTPAQLFHLIRRQLLRPLRRPLIVMSPKSLLRHKQAVSDLNELVNGTFVTVRSDSDGPPPAAVRRLVLCSGKVYYDLHQLRSKQALEDVGLLRIEQLYPFPALELGFEMLRYKNITELVWCQEEPRNQGAWYTTRHRISRVVEGLGLKLELQFAGRDSAAAPATGQLGIHLLQQQQLLEQALGTSTQRRGKRSARQ